MRSHGEQSKVVETMHKQGRVRKRKVHHHYHHHWQPRPVRFYLARTSPRFFCKGEAHKLASNAHPPTRPPVPSFAPPRKRRETLGRDIL